MNPDNFAPTYAAEGWDRAGVDALRGVTLLEFGTDWCPICQGAQSLIREVVGEHPGLRHLKIEDGQGRPLGRSFRITLWPTLVVVKDGVEVGRAVRPRSAAELREPLSRAGGRVAV